MVEKTLWFLNDYFKIKPLVNTRGQTQNQLLRDGKYF